MPHQEVSPGNGHGLKPDTAVLAVLLAVADAVLAQRKRQRKRRKHTRRAFG